MQDNYQDEYSPTITEDELLNEGIYPFTVTNFERKRSSNDSPMVMVTLAVTADGGLKTTVFDYLIINERSNWKISQFFTCLGLRRKGEPFTVDWNKAVGQAGYVDLTLEESAEYGDKNRVGSYLAPDSTKIPVAPAVRTQAAQPSHAYTPGEL